MKNLSRLAAACLSAALLAACAGNTGISPLPKSVAPLTTASSSAKPDTSSLRGEVFTASDVTVQYLGDQRGTKTTKFHASGMAKGPYPGTFVASGKWKQLFLNGRWDFNESFTITSQTRTIKGSIGGYGGCCNIHITNTTFGPVAKSGWLQYHSWIGGIHYSGPVTTNEIEAGSLEEMLHR